MGRSSAAPLQVLRACADAHAVEGTVNENEGDDKKGSGEDVRQRAALRSGQLHGELDGEQAE